MELLAKPTISLCNTCYAHVPATVVYREGSAFLKKTCSAHGEQEAMIDRDALFYAHVSGFRSPSIYNGYLVDVTSRCNLRCEYCYFPLKIDDEAGEYSIDRITFDCAANARHAPFILTGGEPTTRTDLSELIAELRKIGQTEMLTNGVLMVDGERYERIMPLLTTDQGQALVHLSLHRRETDAWLPFLDRCTEDRLKLSSILIVIDSKDDMLEAMRWCLAHADAAVAFRIKVASRVWNEQKPAGQIFVSDMFHWLEEAGMSPKILVHPSLNNKPPFVNVMVQGTWFMLISWPDISNIDMLEIACPPYYRSRSGQVLNFLASALINQGMAEGWLDGRRLGPP